ncbi:hypothetical protein AC629_38660 [Bradyrhizobium sp. NAS80.1]|uniref:hypothetical protein n=1 Tax=Bradyrhizobium sp. NAS80.1 TaxID=1680159 RepID=UPI00095E33E2|nr:hypothetical protein [Bradyrhizobium sp. NAS80.1]OKO72058.1 hypothetical protein AC629_38660 [Bradyrhizobium sp. NAS80.1]
MSGTVSHPFIDTSRWNTPIDKDHTSYSDPGSIENQQFRDTSLANTWVHADMLSFQSSSSDPVAIWTYDRLNDHGAFLSNGSLQIQTPSNMTFFGGSDGWGMLSDSDGRYYEAWDGSYDASTNTYHAAYLVVGDYDTGTGWGDPNTGGGAGVRAAGASLHGGVVTKDELDSSQINHALAIELDPSQLKAGTDGSDQFVFPAVSADSDSTSSYTGTIPMGAHFALPAGLDLSQADLTPEGYALAKAFQDYGGYVVDAAGHTTSLAAIDSSATQAQQNDLFNDMQWIRDHLVMV